MNGDFKRSKNDVKNQKRKIITITTIRCYNNDLILKAFVRSTPTLVGGGKKPVLQLISLSTRSACNQSAKSARLLICGKCNYLPQISLIEIHADVAEQIRHLFKR